LILQLHNIATQTVNFEENCTVSVQKTVSRTICHLRSANSWTDQLM